MKKLLSAIAAIGLVSSMTTMVVACGPLTKEKLLKRTVDTEIYRAIFSSPMTSWSSGTSIEASDSQMITQMQDTLLTPNAHDEWEGSLARWWGHDKNKTEWYFDVRDEATWTGLKKNSWTEYEEKGQIGAKGIFDALRFVMNNYNQSQTQAIWSSMVAEGDGLLKFIGQLIKDYPEQFDNNHIEDSTEGIQARAVRAVDAAILYYNLQYGLWLDANGGENRQKEFNEDGSKNPDHAFDWRKQFGKSVRTEKGPLINESTKDKIIEIANLNQADHDKVVKESFTKGGIIRGTALGEKRNEAIIVTAAKNGQSATSNKEVYNLTVRLQKPAPYFESIAGFVAFAPMPPIAVDYTQPKHSSYNYGNTWDNVWSSGAYLVEENGPNTVLKFKTNPFYFNKDKTYIKQQIYSFVSGIDVSKPRLFFEAGDVSEMAVQSTDLAGWEKYVGPDFDNPIFTGAHAVRKPSTSSFFTVYNYANLGPQENQIQDSSVALAQNSVRAYLSYMLERSELARYFSDAADGPNNNKDQDGKMISKYLRNSYTSPGFSSYIAQDGEIHDYTESMNKVYLEKMKEISAPLTDAKTDNFDKRYAFSNNLKDGFDPLRRNDLLAIQALQKDATAGENKAIYDEFIGIVNQQNQEIDAAPTVEAAKNAKLYTKYEPQKINIFQKRVRADLRKAIDKESVTFKYLMSGTTATTVNINVGNMLGLFNKVAGNPIQIEKVESTDVANLTTLFNKGNYDMATVGWTPDYSDTYNFLHTVTYDGDYNAKQRFTKIFDKEQSNNDKNTKLKANDKLKASGKAAAFEDLRTALEQFTNEVEGTDSVGKYPDRFVEFAKAEYDGILKSNLILPSHTNVGPTMIYLSYTNPFTRPAFPTGSSQYRLFGAKMVPQLMTREQFDAEKALFNDDVNKPAKYWTHLWIYSDNSGKEAQVQKS
ncbi:oligopeptide ABC transporter substrate-binding protein OppA [Williamsoniiplasma lucivorax]|uniref:Oligopeptide ABC transporter substrate-binding protein n=1 Tax=Williamsoniiplasma lucivorax TaxID=209274 RepID=A0A2S5REQ6_9MOLU|nr:oligopeptide ABC transporter substrate-binding protein OppA [Williamsoniiplasma lucivorax]PPE05777.1 oligopeptide ABC transporter substrate-binding protein [Williamsoniiplasma lucivorax]